MRAPIRAAAPVLAATLFAVPALALAETSGSGQIVCEQEVGHLSQILQDQSANMTPGQITSINRQLRMANEECPQGYNYVSPQLSQLRQELGVTPGQQTAQVPENGAPPDQGGR